MDYKPNWNRQSTSSGYSVTHCPDHPKAWSSGYVYTHRLVAEDFLGRLLKEDEVVHHVDGDKLNNKPENLEVTSASSHATKHAQPQWVELSCAFCDTKFKRKANQTPWAKGYKRAFCSRSCNGKYK